MWEGKGIRYLERDAAFKLGINAGRKIRDRYVLTPSQKFITFKRNCKLYSCIFIGSQQYKDLKNNDKCEWNLTVAHKTSTFTQSLPICDTFLKSHKM